MERAEAKLCYQRLIIPIPDSVHMERAEAKTSSQAKLRDLIPIQSTWNVPRQSAIKSVTPSSDKNGFSPHGTCRGKDRKCLIAGIRILDSVHMERAEAKSGVQIQSCVQ